ncbi:hypothetical protein ACFSQQ_14655 [Mesorhizobium kowhaii]|uniref:hypothetical protein n=1 Tax=Mesorhizobium kowhaii TaxID=1300272 RepID=UPI0035EE171D
MRPPEKQKPIAGKATGFQKIEQLPGVFDNSEDRQNARLLQARRIHRRFAISWPLANAVAELAFGRVPA